MRAMASTPETLLSSLPDTFPDSAPYKTRIHDAAER